VSKAFVKLNNSTIKASAGPTGSTGNTGPDIGGVGVKLTDTDTVSFNRGGSNNTTKVVGEVWRYTGSSGGINEFIKRGSYELSFGNTDTSASVAVSGLTNKDDCVPFLTGWTTDNTNVNDYDEVCFGVYLDSSGNLQATRQATGSSATVYVDVVEFTGSNWSIGHGISTNHDSSISTVTLNRDSTGTGGVAYDVGDWSKAFIEASMQGDTSESGLADLQALVYPTENGTTQVHFDITSGDGSARCDGNGYVHVLKNEDLIVTRRYDTSIPEGNGSYGTTDWPSGASTTRNIDQLSLEWYVSTSGTGTAWMRGCLGTRITDPTGTITHWVHRAGNNVIARYGVIDLSQLTSPVSTDSTIDYTQAGDIVSATIINPIDIEVYSTQNNQTLSSSLDKASNTAFSINTNTITNFDASVIKSQTFSLNTNTTLSYSGLALRTLDSTFDISTTTNTDLNGFAVGAGEESSFSISTQSTSSFLHNSITTPTEILPPFDSGSDSMQWVFPASKQLGTVLELRAGTPVFSQTLNVQSGILADSNTLPEDYVTQSTSPIYYRLIAGEIPHYYKFVHTETNIGYLHITPIVRELDEYVPEYAKPDNFVWDTEDTGGGNYATFGSALSGGHTFTFTIRGYDASSLQSYTDSNGDLQYIVDSNGLPNKYADREFSIFVENNWSSDRDSFILDYFDGKLLEFDGELFTPEDYLLKVKSEGYLD